MSGAIPPLPQYALMALCSFKAQGQIYLYLPLPSSGQFNQNWKAAKLKGQPSLKM
jgi:hypothetical protein